MVTNNAMFHTIDIDECQVNNGHCSHRCKNTAGSYYCKCKAGYQLQPDKHSCKGINLLHISLFECITCMHTWIKITTLIEN